MTHYTLPSFLSDVTPGLYLVATPIGNRGDITLRALHTLQKVDIIYCEDTRVSRPLLSTYGIGTPLKSYHDYNGEKIRPQIMEAIQQGKAVALISDAGMPLISDPGFKLVKACQEAGLSVTCVPGASAVLAGLVLSGMPNDAFLFAGFPKTKELADFISLDVTLIFFEAPHRLLETLKTFSSHFQNRSVSVVREITKTFEEVVRGDFQTVIRSFEERDKVLGECVIVLSPPEKSKQTLSEIDIDQIIKDTLHKGHSIKDACTLIAGAYHLPKKQVYQRALLLQKNP